MRNAKRGLQSLLILYWLVLWNSNGVCRSVSACSIVFSQERTCTVLTHAFCTSLTALTSYLDRPRAICIIKCEGGWRIPFTLSCRWCIMPKCKRLDRNTYKYTVCQHAECILVALKYDVSFSNHHQFQSAAPYNLHRARGQWGLYITILYANLAYGYESWRQAAGLCETWKK